MVFSTYYSPPSKQVSHTSHFKANFAGANAMKTKDLPKTLQEVEEAYLKRTALTFLDQKLTSNISKREFLKKEHIGAGTLSRALQSVGVFPRTFVYEDEERGGALKNMRVRKRASGSNQKKSTKKKGGEKGGASINYGPRQWEQKGEITNEVLALQKEAGIL